MVLTYNEEIASGLILKNMKKIKTSINYQLITVILDS